MFNQKQDNHQDIKHGFAFSITTINMSCDNDGEGYQREKKT